MEDPGSSAAPRPISGRRFVAVFAGVALSFIAAAGYAQYVQYAVDRGAAQIAEMAAPSIHRLVNAQARLRHVQSLLYGRLVNGAGLAHLGLAMAEHDRLRADIAAYRGLPMFTGEDQLWAEVRLEIERVDRTLDEIFRRYTHRDAQGALDLIQGVLVDEADRAARAIDTSVDFVANQSARVAHEIQDTRERAIIIQALLCAVASVLTIVAALLLLRTVQGYTHLLEAHSQLLARRADELEQFAARVAHDILSPLQTTTLALTLADRALPPEASSHAAVHRGQRSVQRVQTIVEGLLRFAMAGARPGPGDRTEVAPVLDDLLAEARALAEERHIEIHASPPPQGAVACSRGVLTSLVHNLVQNAIKYMDGDRPERRIEVRVLECGDWLRFEVADTGPGIPADYLPGLFDPYIRGPNSGQPGLGLGLATVRRIAEAHGGAAGVRSVVGEGSTFWFELRRAPEPSTPSPRA